MARVNTIGIPTPPKSSQITVGMHLVKAPIETNKYAKEKIGMYLV
jgi:hypothetical protein